MFAYCDLIRNAVFNGKCGQTLVGVDDTTSGVETRNHIHRRRIIIFIVNTTH